MIYITFVYSYYENGEMFKLQQRTWESYPEDVRNQIEFIVTDDCSVKNPARNNRISPKLNMSLYEITKKVQWNWLECRNIGAYYAKGAWLLLTDMDHVVTADMAIRLMERWPSLSYKTVYQFNRIRAVDMQPYKFHNDSFFLTKKMFWRCGGYDEELSGNYGTSGVFRERLLKTANDRRERLSDMSLLLYGREVLPDASTTEFARKEGRDPNVIKRIMAAKRDANRGILLFQQPYRKVE
jgi:hypothetical protein